MTTTALEKVEPPTIEGKQYDLFLTTFEKINMPIRWMTGVCLMADLNNISLMFARYALNELIAGNKIVAEKGILSLK